MHEVRLGTTVARPWPAGEVSGVRTHRQQPDAQRQAGQRTCSRGRGGRPCAARARRACA